MATPAPATPCCCSRTAPAAASRSTHGSPLATDFAEALEALCVHLAKEMARDGEGATKLIEFTRHRRSLDRRRTRPRTADCRPPTCSRAPSTAPTRTGAACRGRGPFRGHGVRSRGLPSTICGTRVFEREQPTEFDPAAVADAMRGDTVTIESTSARASATATGWGCDLSAEYVIDQRRLPHMSGPLVIKIGGSTLGSADTRFAMSPRWRHRATSRWSSMAAAPRRAAGCEAMDIPSRFERGLRVTDERVLPVVVAVFAGLVNKRIVAAINAAGAPALGLSGADGRILECTHCRHDSDSWANQCACGPTPSMRCSAAGIVPVISSIGFVPGEGSDQLVNVNADTIAGEIAAALGAERLVFLTDVEGVRDADGRGDAPASTRSQAVALIAGRHHRRRHDPKGRSMPARAGTRRARADRGRPQAGALLTRLAGRRALSFEP